MYLVSSMAEVRGRFDGIFLERCVRIVKMGSLVNRMRAPWPFYQLSLPERKMLASQEVETYPPMYVSLLDQELSISPKFESAVAEVGFFIACTGGKETADVYSLRVRWQERPLLLFSLLTNHNSRTAHRPLRTKLQAQSLVYEPINADSGVRPTSSLCLSFMSRIQPHP